MAWLGCLLFCETFEMFIIVWNIWDVYYCVKHLRCLLFCETFEMFIILWNIWDVYYCVKHLRCLFLGHIMLILILIKWKYTIRCYYMSPVKRICVFEHSVMTNFNCACPAIQRGYGSGFLSEGSSWLTACMSEQRRFWRDCADAQARLNLRCSHRR